MSEASAITHLVLVALSFKVGTLAEDFDGLSDASRVKFETDTHTYSILMTFMLLGGLLLFVLMAPFELRRISRTVTHPARRDASATPDTVPCYP